MVLLQLGDYHRPSLEAGCFWLLGTGAASPSRERDELPEALPLRASFHALQEQQTRAGQVPLLPVPSSQSREQLAEPFVGSTVPAHTSAI